MCSEIVIGWMVGVVSMYTLDWLGVFKEGFSWLYDAGKFNLDKQKQYGIEIGYLLIAALFAMIVVGVLAYLSVPLFKNAIKGDAVSVLVALVFLFVFIVLSILFSVYLLHIRKKIFADAFEKFGYTFKDTLDFNSSFRYFIFTIVEYFYKLLALPSKLKFIAIPLFLIDCIAVLILLVAFTGIINLSASLILLLVFILLAGFVIQVPIAIYMGVRLAPAHPIYFEGNDMLASLDQSFALTSGKGIKIFLTEFICGFLLQIITNSVLQGVQMVIIIPLYILILISMVVFFCLPIVFILILLAVLLIYIALVTVFLAFDAYFKTALYNNIQNYTKFE